jgi:hypothetical protein
MYVGLYVAANRDRDQFADDDRHDRDGVGFFAWLSSCLRRLFAIKS